MNLDRTNVGKAFAEYVGTFTLAAIVIIMTQTIGQPFLTGLAAALVVATFTTTVGTVSGAHLNPAVTLGFLSLRKIRALEAVGYWIFQFLGAFSALKLVEYMYGQKIPGGNFKGELKLKIFLAELIGTAVFTFGFASVVNRRVEGYQASAAIGTSLFLGIMLASMGSSAAVNPAVALGANTLNWNYALGPFVGALLAMNLQNLLTSDADETIVGRPLNRWLPALRSRVSAPAAATSRSTAAKRKPSAAAKSRKRK